MLSLYGPTFNKVEFVPHCLPNLPEILTPKAAAVRKVILQVAEIFGATDNFCWVQTKWGGVGFPFIKLMVKFLKIEEVMVLYQAIVDFSMVLIRVSGVDWVLVVILRLL